MPTYVYRCDTCTLEIHTVRKITQPELKPVCINCQKEMRRDYETIPIHFNGKGWASAE